MNTQAQDHYCGLTNRLYMMLQSIECCDMYFSAHHLSDSDSVDMNVAYIWFCQTKRSEDFQRKVLARHPLIKEYCSEMGLSVEGVNDYDTLYELYYLLNAPDITQETVPEYVHSLDDLITEQSNGSAPQQMPPVYESSVPATTDYLTEHSKRLRPLYHTLKHQQPDISPEKLASVEYRFEKHYETLRSSISRFLPAA